MFARRSFTILYEDAYLIFLRFDFKSLAITYLKHILYDLLNMVYLTCYRCISKTDLY